MFKIFSRSGNVPDKANTDISAAILEANRAAQERASSRHKATPDIPPNSSGTSGSDVITELKNVPTKGEYKSWISLNIHNSFNKIGAFFSTEFETGFLLIAVEHYGSAIHLDMKQRLLACGYQNVEQSKCSSEVLQAIHSSNASQAVQMSMSATDIEKKGWALFSKALEMGASDVHIETRTSFAQVFFRINGLRVEQDNMAFETAVSMAQSLFNTAGDEAGRKKNWSADDICDISISKILNGKPAQIRFTSAPIYPSSPNKNFHVVCRILVMNDSNRKDISQIGYSLRQEAYIRESLVGSQGIVLLVGPTNSGKSTAMQTLAYEFIKKRIGTQPKVISTEQPVEYVIESACQMTVPSMKDAKAEEALFAQYVKSTLRQDGDLIIIGEIRDQATVSAVTSAALAGRKILATLHVFEALAAFPRLKEMGMSESVLYMKGFINSIIYQRLVPSLCPHCSLNFESAINLGIIDPLVLNRLQKLTDQSVLNNIKFKSLTGCNECNSTGIAGRTICAEIIKPDVALLDLLRNGNIEGARNYWLSNIDLNINGFGVSAIAHGIQKMLNGEIDPHDLENSIGLIQGDRISNEMIVDSFGASTFSHARGHDEFSGWVSHPEQAIR